MKNRCCATTREGKRCKQKTVFVLENERAIVCRSHLFPSDFDTDSTVGLYEEVIKNLSPPSRERYAENLPLFISRDFLSFCLLPYDQDLYFHFPTPLLERIENRVIISEKEIMDVVPNFWCGKRRGVLSRLCDWMNTSSLAEDQLLTA